AQWRATEFKGRPHRQDLYVYGLAAGAGQVRVQTLTDDVRVFKAFFVVAVQIELERLGFDQVGTVHGDGEAPDRSDRLALGVQPGQLIGVPDIGAVGGLGEIQTGACLGSG